MKPGILSVRRQSGAAMIEYAVGVMMFVMVICFLPLPKALGGDGNKSAVEMLVETIKRNYSSYEWGMSIPV